MGVESFEIGPNDELIPSKRTEDDRTPTEEAEALQGAKGVQEREALVRKIEELKSAAHFARNAEEARQKQTEAEKLEAELEKMSQQAA